MMKAGEEVLRSAVGTPLYAAPEIFNGENYDERVDVYSYGLILLAFAGNVTAGAALLVAAVIAIPALSSLYRYSSVSSTIWENKP